MDVDDKYHDDDVWWIVDSPKSDKNDNYMRNYYNRNSSQVNAFTEPLDDDDNFSKNVDSIDDDILASVLEPDPSEHYNHIHPKLPGGMLKLDGFSFITEGMSLNHYESRKTPLHINNSTNIQSKEIHNISLDTSRIRNDIDISLSDLVNKLDDDIHILKSTFHIEDKKDQKDGKITTSATTSETDRNHDHCILSSSSIEKSKEPEEELMNAVISLNSDSASPISINGKINKLFTYNLDDSNEDYYYHVHNENNLLSNSYDRKVHRPLVYSMNNNNNNNSTSIIRHSYDSNRTDNNTNTNVNENRPHNHNSHLLLPSSQSFPISLLPNSDAPSLILPSSSSTTMIRSSLDMTQLVDEEMILTTEIYDKIRYLHKELHERSNYLSTLLHPEHNTTTNTTSSSSRVNSNNQRYDDGKINSYDQIQMEIQEKGNLAREPEYKYNRYNNEENKAHIYPMSTNNSRFRQPLNNHDDSLFTKKKDSVSSSISIPVPSADSVASVSKQVVSLLNITMNTLAHSLTPMNPIDESNVTSGNTTDSSQTTVANNDIKSITTSFSKENIPTLFTTPATTTATPTNISSANVTILPGSNTTTTTTTHQVINEVLDRLDKLLIEPSIESESADTRVRNRLMSSSFYTTSTSCYLSPSYTASIHRDTNVNTTTTHPTSSTQSNNYQPYHIVYSNLPSARRQPSPAYTTTSSTGNNSTKVPPSRVNTAQISLRQIHYAYNPSSSSSIQSSTVYQNNAYSNRVEKAIDTETNALSDNNVNNDPEINRNIESGEDNTKSGKSRIKPTIIHSKIRPDRQPLHEHIPNMSSISSSGNKFDSMQYPNYEYNIMSNTKKILLSSSSKNIHETSKGEKDQDIRKQYTYAHEPHNNNNNNNKVHTRSQKMNKTHTLYPQEKKMTSSYENALSDILDRENELRKLKLLRHMMSDTLLHV